MYFVVLSGVLSCIVVFSWLAVRAWLQGVPPGRTHLHRGLCEDRSPHGTQGVLEQLRGNAGPWQTLRPKICFHRKWWVSTVWFSTFLISRRHNLIGYWPQFVFFFPPFFNVHPVKSTICGFYALYECICKLIFCIALSGKMLKCNFSSQVWTSLTYRGFI